MKRILLGAVAALTLATFAFAGDEVMTTRFGNTTKVTYPNGTVVKIWYAADHTWTGDTNGTAINGTWAVEGDKVCVTTANMPAGMNMPTRQCNPVAERKVGETWTIDTPGGQIKAELLAGKQ